MRVNLTLNDGRQIQTGSRMRYCCFRLTLQGGFAVKHDQNAEPLVKWAVDNRNMTGNHYLIVDTVAAEAIAYYPCIEKNWIKGHPPMKADEDIDA